MYTASNNMVNVIILNILTGTITKVLHENIDQTLLNKLHGPMHYKIDVTCVYNRHMFYTPTI